MAQSSDRRSDQDQNRQESRVPFGQGVEALDIMASTPFCGSAFMIDIGMIPKAAGVRLTPEDRAALEARLRAPRTGERKIDLSGRKSWCESNDPESVAGRRRSSGSIWRRPRTRSAFARTRSPRSRLWSGHPSMDLLPIDVSDLHDPTAAGYGEMVTLIWRGDRYRRCRGGD